ncbi:MAG: DUF6249 domain-containing protein [Candidatus Acidiferrales bacterium]
MDASFIGLAAVVLALCFPLAIVYAIYRIRQLKTQERLAAISRGVPVPVESDLPPHARSRRAGILLVAGSLGYSLTFWLLGRYDSEVAAAAAFGIIPFAIGVGYFIDAKLVRRELHPTG